jgi:hypothetical protein
MGPVMRSGWAAKHRDEARSGRRNFQDRIKSPSAMVRLLG